MTAKYPATLICDFYKVNHKDQYPKGTQVVYSTWTPRGSRMKGVDKVVMFGLQGLIKEWFLDYFDTHFFSRPEDEVASEYVRVIKYTLGVEAPDDTHIRELHRYGRLPITIRGLKEGTLAPLRVPMFTIENTRPDLLNSFWVTNYLETLTSNYIWQPMTSATIAFEYRKLVSKYAIETVGTDAGVEFQCHDFSNRGMGGIDSSRTSAAGHLLPFVGTDTIGGILYHEAYYNANIEKELIGTSIPATEHSVTCANGMDEQAFLDRLITEIYPSGFVSNVSDTWDFWNNVENVIPAIKEKIMNRDGRYVVRPDSGDPVEIVCGSEIEDLSNEDNLDECKYYMIDKIVGQVREETPHGEHGDTDVSAIFKYKDAYYKIKVEIEWNRHDKQYYYIDGKRISKFEEIVPTAEQLGLIESLWNTFGGTITDKGYKLLDPHIGAIYGDSITIERANTILKRLKAKGFASTNIVFGVGSFTYQYNTRDTFYFAMKATHAVINGEEKFLFKDPKTDNGVKRSQRGRVVVIKDDDGNIKYIDGLTIEEQNKYNDNLLAPVFVDGKLVCEQNLAEIRKELLSHL